MDAMNTPNVLNIQLENEDESSEVSTCENGSFCVECEQLKCKLSVSEVSIQNLNKLIALMTQINEDKVQSYETRIKNQDKKIENLESGLKLHTEKLTEQNEYLNKYKDQIALIEAKIKDNQEEIIKNDLLLKEQTDTIKELQKKITDLQTKAKLDEIKLQKKDNLLAEYTKHKVDDITATFIPFESQNIETNMNIKYVTGQSAIRLYYEDGIAGPGWIIIQHCIENIMHKYDSIEDFETTSGDPKDYYWLGLENIHRITTKQQHELYIHLVGRNDEIRYARYDNFVVGSKEEQFELKSLGKYTGNAGDAMRCSEGLKFKYFWWVSQTKFKYDCNLMGEVYCNNVQDIWWRNFANGETQALKSAKMLIKPK